ncbi:NAD-glutamate dehydrogenase, partial [Vibrio parahaemolyticus]|uniref:NAD-glutamate dehydrogenase domain-containing protein n=1 Tax=Vibrio parahaemolyticus TaxID=670 RepID=UPI001A90390B|nr:NAD-glutamate dehydrogenase [Vibrio parahaemolyticus]
VPFVVDSARMVVNRFGYQIHFIIHFGGFKVIRDLHHRVTDIAAKGDAQATGEAPVYIEIDRITDEKAMAELQHEIENALS